MIIEIKPLTSIRGIAALLVMIYHFHQTDAAPFALLGNIIDKGYLWVDLFFVLSGFVMALTYAAPFATGFDRRVYWSFLGKRIARVYPLYFAVTMAISAYSLVIYGGYSGAHRPGINLDQPLLAHVTNLLMIHAWGFGSSIGGPTWSISTEWAAYLLFPWLAYFALYAGRYAAWLLALFATALLVYVAVTPETGQTVRNGAMDIYHCKDFLAVMRCLAGFMLGLLAYRLKDNAAIKSWLGQDWCCFALFAALIAAMALQLHDLLIYPLLPALVLSLATVQGAAARCFSWKPFHHLGVLSYSIYLIHAHALVLLQQLQLRLPAYLGADLANWVAAFVTYAAVFFCAIVSYLTIEKPGRVLLRRVLSGAQALQENVGNIVAAGAAAAPQTSQEKT